MLSLSTVSFCFGKTRQRLHRPAMGLRFIYSQNRSWHRFRTKMRTIVEEAETDNETQLGKKNSSELHPLNLRPSYKDSKKKIMELKGSLEYRDFPSKTGAQKSVFYSHTEEPKCLTLTNISPRSSQFHTSKPLNEETLSSQDLASRLFPEFFAEQLDHNRRDNEYVTLKPDDPLVDSWLGFYGM